eukprot:9655512-Karenia_brevis.AAC.1
MMVMMAMAAPIARIERINEDDVAMAARIVHQRKIHDDDDDDDDDDGHDDSHGSSYCFKMKT